MSRVLAVKVGPLASASSTNIAASQPLSGAGNLTLASAVVTLDQPRHVIITSLTGDNSGVTFTVYGTDFAGYPLQASILGAHSTGTPLAVDVGVSFKTVTQVAGSGATTGNVEVGTNTVADSAPLNLDEFGFPAVSLQVVASGTVNYTVNQTLDDFTNPYWIGGTGAAATSFAAATWLNSADSNVVAATSSQQSNYAFVPKWTRVTLNSGTGSVVMSVIQAASPSI